MQCVLLDDACRAGKLIASREPDFQPFGFYFSCNLVIGVRHSKCYYFRYCRKITNFFREIPHTFQCFCHARSIMCPGRVLAQSSCLPDVFGEPTAADSNERSE
jgi:hypothetical protein